MHDMSRPEAIYWLVNNPPRHLPPQGWAWCEPDDKSKPWHLFRIDMGKGEDDDICETLRDAKMCNLARLDLDSMSCKSCGVLQFYDVDSPWESYVCGEQMPAAAEGGGS